MLRAETGTDLAMYNGGGLRSDLPEGTILRRDLYNIFPFGNEVVTFQITGTELMALLLANVMAAEEESRGAIQISGASLIWREVMGAPEVVEIQVNGASLEPERLYTVATNTYVVDQAARYLAGAAPKDVRPTGQSVFDLADQHISRIGEVSPPADARLTRLP